MKPDCACSFCGRSATLKPTAELRVCWSCAKLVASVVAENEPKRIADIWSSAPTPLGQAEPPAADRGEIDIERVFADFKEGVAKNISADDAESHSHLAEAYREIGLYVDAVREAAVALAAAMAPGRAEAPLRFLLTPPLLRPDGLGLLRERLKARGR